MSVLLNMDVLCAFENTTNYRVLREYIDATQGYLSEINVPLSQDIDNQRLYGRLRCEDEMFD